MENNDQEIEKLSSTISSLKAQLDDINIMLQDAAACKNSVSKQVLTATVKKYLVKFNGNSEASTVR